MSNIKRSKSKSSESGEKLGPMKVVRHKASERKRLPPELEAFARSDEKRIRKPKGSKQLNDPRLVYLVPGVANRHARLVYDARVEQIEKALAAYQDAEVGKNTLAKGLATAVALGVWRGKSLTSFEAFVEGVLAMDLDEAKSLAVEGGASEDLARLSDHVIAVWMRVEAALLEEGVDGEVSLDADGKQIVLKLDAQKAPEAFGAISRLVSPMAEPVQERFDSNEEPAFREERAPRAAAKSKKKDADADLEVDALDVDSDIDSGSIDGDSDADVNDEAFSVASDGEGVSDEDKPSAWSRRKTPGKTAFLGSLDDNAWTPGKSGGTKREFGGGPKRDFGGGPKRDFGGGGKRDFGGPRKDFGGGPRKDFGGGGAKRDFGGPRRSFGDDRGPRRDFGDKPRGPRRDFGDAPRGPRKEFGGGGPRKDFGGPRRDFGGGGGADRGPRRDFGGGGSADRGPRRSFGDDRGPRRDFGDAPRGPRKDFGGGDRGPRRDFGDAPRGPRKDFGGGDRGPRRDFGGGGDRAPRRDFGDKPRGPRKDFGGGDRGPRRDFGDKPRGPRSDAGDRKPRGFKR